MPKRYCQGLLDGVRSMNKRGTMVILTGVVESQLLDDSGPKDFKPFPLVEDLYLKTRRREGEVGFSPTDLKRRISCSSTKQLQQKGINGEFEVEGGELGVFRIMGRLGWICGGDMGYVLDDDIRPPKMLTQAFVICFEFLDPSPVCPEYTSALHLVENGVVR